MMHDFAKNGKKKRRKYGFQAADFQDEAIWDVI